MERFLDRFQPLPRILYCDDFAQGMQGWAGYFPDFDGEHEHPRRYPHVEPLDEIVRRSRSEAMRVDRRAPLGARVMPQLSCLSSADIGSTGASSGPYALKIPTLPRRGAKNLACKRMVCPWPGQVRLETWFCFKGYPADRALGEADVASIILSFDAMDLHRPWDEEFQPRRWWPSLRYRNYEDGAFIGRWQTNTRGNEGTKDGPWTDLEDGRQDLAYNRSPSKYQWHYLRFTFDTVQHELVDFHCHGQEFAVAGLSHRPDPPLQGWRASTDKCAGLLNCTFAIDPGTDTRCALYLDGVVVSCGQ